MQMRINPTTKEIEQNELETYSKEKKEEIRQIMNGFTFEINNHGGLTVIYNDGK